MALRKRTSTEFPSRALGVGDLGRLLDGTGRLSRRLISHTMLSKPVGLASPPICRNLPLPQATLHANCRCSLTSSIEHGENVTPRPCHGRLLRQAFPPNRPRQTSQARWLVSSCSLCSLDARAEPREIPQNQGDCKGRTKRGLSLY